MPKRGANALMPSRSRKRPAPIETPQNETPKFETPPPAQNSPALGALTSLASKLKGGLLAKIVQKPAEEEAPEVTG